mgnify:CR=1 FL=1|jgi:hypothetical protein
MQKCKIFYYKNIQRKINKILTIIYNKINKMITNL